jgi:hypothetical protein
MIADSRGADRPCPGRLSAESLQLFSVDFFAALAAAEIPGGFEVARPCCGIEIWLPSGQRITFLLLHF